MYWVFVNKIDEFNNEAIVLDDKNETRFWRLREKIEDDNCELVWDSAHTLESAFQYAAEQYHAYPRTCTNCSSYREVDLYRGKKYDFKDEKWTVFNGYLCEPCATDDYLFDVSFIQNYKPKVGLKQ